MTRHKQQLLQEQECLLEQIQRQNNSDTSEDLGHDETKLLTSLRKKKDNAEELTELNDPIAFAFAIEKSPVYLLNRRYAMT